MTKVIVLHDHESFYLLFDANNSVRKVLGRLGESLVGPAEPQVPNGRLPPRPGLDNYIRSGSPNPS